MPQLQKITNAPPPKPLANTMELLHERLASLSEQSTVLENTADAENRPLSEAELAEMGRVTREFKQVEAEIAAREESAIMASKLAMPQRRVTQPDDTGVDNTPNRSSGVQVGDRVGVQKGGWGFRSLGEYAIAAASTFRNRPDPRIVNAPSTYGSEAQSADGGFAVPPDFRATIMKQIEGEESLFSRTDQQVTQGNSLVLPLDSTTPWATSGGVQGGWSGEGQGITLSKPALGQLETKANKLTALVALTDELLEDVPAMTRWLQTKVPEKFTSLLNTAIVTGTGVGQPQGLLNANCKVTAAAVSGQGAATVIGKNLSAMWARMYAPLRRNAIWLINQDLEPQLQNIVAPGATFPAYMPPGGYSQSPYSTIFNRPVISLEACSALGTEGDIILFDPTQYLTVVKSGGMRSDVSIHLFFDTDHTAFRFVMRVGGQSYWPAAAARTNGSNTLSPIVTLNSTRT